MTPTPDAQRKFAGAASHVTKVQVFEKALQVTGLGQALEQHRVTDFHGAWAKARRQGTIPSWSLGGWCGPTVEEMGKEAAKRRQARKGGGQN